MMSMMDTNKDGKLSKEEYLSGMASMNKEQTREQNSVHFSMLDRDGDGFLSHKELTPDTGTSSGPQFQNLDKNKDGNITVDEFTAFSKMMDKEVKTDAEYAKEFAKYDKNGNGGLDRAEFEALLKSKAGVNEFDDKGGSKPGMGGGPKPGMGGGPKPGMGGGSKPGMCNKQKVDQCMSRSKAGGGGTTGGSGSSGGMNGGSGGMNGGGSSSAPKFEDADIDPKDGKVSAKEFVAFAMRTDPKKMTQKEYEIMFGKLDKDGDKFLDMKEFDELVKNDGGGNDAAAGMSMFEKSDTNKDKKLSKDEFTSMMAAASPTADPTSKIFKDQISMLFKVYDKDGDGFLNETEMGGDKSSGTTSGSKKRRRSCMFTLQEGHTWELHF